MRKIYFAIALLLSVVAVKTVSVQAASGYLSVNIISPTSVEAYPGYETTIQAEITNNTTEVQTDLVVYITMVDLTKNMTVNLEDYNADVPVVISKIQPNETITVELPIVLVYPDVFHLYVSVASTNSMTIISSDSITSHIITQSNINPTYVMTASIVSPIIVLAGFVGLNIYRKRFFH
jgi:hypothetical protein